MQIIQRVIYLIVVTTITLNLLGCISSHDKEVQKVGDINFCIPNENRRDIHIWWIPKELPEGGLLFSLPVILESKSTIEISGIISNIETYPSWKGKPAPDSQWWKDLSKFEGRRLIAGGQYIATNSDNNYSYLVWSPGHKPTLLNDEYTEEAQVIADCNVPRLNSKQGGTCNRVVYIDSIAVEYTFDANLIEKIEWLDKKVTHVVNDWKCLG